MTAEVEAEFRAHALERHPHECGGVIVQREDGTFFYMRVRNDSRSPGDGYKSNSSDLSAAHSAGEVVAFCHSHPDASPKPSQADLVQCELHGIPWYIVSVGESTTGDITETLPTGYVAPLLGRSFHHGVLDCYALVKDWYWQERGIKLGCYNRDYRWWLDGGNLYLDNYEKEGFARVTDGTLEVGDILLMTIRSRVPNHAAVFVGDNMILHHYEGQLSSREIYGKFWRDVTTLVIRRVEK